MSLRRLSGSNRTNSLLSNRSNSFSSADGSQASNSKEKRSKHGDGKLPPPILVYHESAHSIVFRDHLRRVAKHQGSSSISNDEEDQNEQQQQQPTTARLGGGTNKTDDVKKNTTAANNYASPDARKRETSQKQDSFVKITSELSQKLGIDRGETVMPSQAQIPSNQIANFLPRIQPLPRLALGPDDHFEPLINQPPAVHLVINSSDDSVDNNATGKDWSPAEREVVQLLLTEQACVKTIRNGDWTAFLTRFRTLPQPPPNHHHTAKLPGQQQQQQRHHADIAKHDGEEFPFNSFVTSTSLLPTSGKKMRCFGATSQYTVGVVFALPSSYHNPNSKVNENSECIEETEGEACKRTRTWSWPAGYSAKTEFNIDSRGNLINGREEALTPLAVLRQYNHQYLNDKEYTVAGRKVSGLSQIPYNEVFLRVGGRGRIVCGRDCVSDKVRNDKDGTGRDRKSVV